MEFLKLFYIFFMIGAMTFGGGYAMLPMIQEQVGIHWGNVIPPDTLGNFVGIAESTPGPFAINMATYVGATVGDQYGGLMPVLGSFCATLGVVLPSFIVILIVAKCYDKFRNSRVVKGCMSGLKPAVVGLIGFAILKMILNVFFDPNAKVIEEIFVAKTLEVFTAPAFYVSLGTAAVMLVLAFKKVHPIILVCCSAAVGIGAGYLGVWG